MNHADFFKGRLAVEVPEAARVLSLSPRTLYNQIHEGRCPLPTFKFGGKRLIRVADILKLLDLDETAVEIEAHTPTVTTSKVGRYKNSEKLEARRLGITVKQLRTREAA